MGILLNVKQLCIQGAQSIQVPGWEGKAGSGFWREKRLANEQKVAVFFLLLLFRFVFVFLFRMRAITT